MQEYIARGQLYGTLVGKFNDWEVVNLKILKVNGNSLSFQN